MLLNTNEITTTETLSNEVVNARVVFMGHALTVGSIPDPRPHFLLCEEAEEDFAMMGENPFWTDEPSELVF